MKSPRTPVIALTLLLLASGCAGSYAPRAPLPTSAEDNTPALKRNPQFPAAAAVAPDFVSATFEVIHRLEKEKANAGQ